jgi:hypothetical protein
MNQFLSQLIIAQKEDIEKWMNILFIVVLAVFWVLRSVVKTKVDEAQQRKKKDASLNKNRKPAPSTKELSEVLLDRVIKYRESAYGNRQRPNNQRPSTKSSSAGAAGRGTASKAQPALSSPFSAKRGRRQSKFAFQQPSLKRDVQKFEKIDTNMEQLPEFSPKSIDKLDDSPLGKSSRFSQPEFVSDLIWDYKNPDELRKAILHYEILGKPLSLRDSSESFL